MMSNRRENLHDRIKRVQERSQQARVSKKQETNTAEVQHRQMQSYPDDGRLKRENSEKQVADHFGHGHPVENVDDQEVQDQYQSVEKLDTTGGAVDVDQGGRAQVAHQDQKQHQQMASENEVHWVDQHDAGSDLVAGTGNNDQDGGSLNLSSVQQEQAEETAELPKRSNKLFKTFGTIALAIGIVALPFVNTTTVDTSDQAQRALSEQVSTELSTGAVILSADEELAAQDHTIVHNSDAEETKIWVWDYAAEDGDYVQVLVNGTPMTDAFMIKHKPREITVPAVGTVEIKGVRDGGGGITYAVRYDINGTTYFNTAPLNGQNIYELIRE